MPKEEREKLEGGRKKKQVEEEAKKGQVAKEERSTFDKRVDAASGVKTEVAGNAAPSSKAQAAEPVASVDKTLPSSSQGVKEEILTPALAAWEEVKKKLEAKQKLEKEQEEREERKAAGTETPPDWNMSSSSSTSSSSPKKSSNKAGGVLTKEKQEELLPTHLKVLLTKENLRPAGAVVLLTKQHHVNLLWCQDKK